MSKIRRRTESVTSVSDAVADFLASAEVRRLKHKTQQEYRGNLGVFAEWCSEHALTQNKQTKEWQAIKVDSRHHEIYLHQVNATAVHLFQSHLRLTRKPAKSTAVQLSVHTIAAYTKAITRLLNWCLADEQYSVHVKLSSIQRIEKPSVQSAPPPDLFTDEDVEALRSACKKERYPHLRLRDEAILAVLVDTGIRATELCLLTIGHVHLDARDPHIRVYGKGNKWREIGLGNDARRIVQKYIREFREPTEEYRIADSLKNLPDRERSKRLKEAFSASRLFVNRSGNPLTKSGLDQIFQRIADWAGINDKRCSPHNCRYYFAVQFIMLNDDKNATYRLSKLLGHTSVKVTEQYLRAYTQSEARKGVNSVLDNL